MVLEYSIVPHQKNLFINSTIFPHQNIHKFTWIAPNGKTKNHNDHILKDRRLHLSILVVQSLWEADCDTHHYLVVAKVRERVAVINPLTPNTTIVVVPHR